MEAAHITWRPLGQLFVERGLITQEELEVALVEQRDTRKRLGTILVGRGLVSGPELTSVLVDQLGMELTKESGYGSGLWDEIRKRHPRGRDRREPDLAPAEPAAEEPVFAPAPAVKEEPEPAPAAPDPARLEADLFKERAALAAAVAEERAELEAALGEERAQLKASLKAERGMLQAALDEERTARQQALQELMQIRAEVSAKSAELEHLGGQVEVLRRDLAERDTSKLHSREGIEALESRIASLERSLAGEQAAHSLAVEELDLARAQVGAEAGELRTSIERLRKEFERLDASTSWLEHWSGAGVPESAKEAKAEA